MKTKQNTSITDTSRKLLIYAAILAAVALPYFNSLSNKFALDDVPVVENNPLIRSWHSIPDIFTQGYWTQTGLGSGGLYRPLTILSYLFEFQAFKLDTFFYHLDNILLHIICCILVYLVIEALSSDRYASLFSAVLFAVHPVHVEVVSNVVGRAELLTTLFTLGGFYTFIKPPRLVPWYIVSPALMFLGLMSKETAVVLPLLVLAYLLVYERDGRGKGLKGIAASLAPYAAVTAAFLLIRFAVLSNEVVPSGGEQVLVYTKGYWRFLVMTKVFMQYLRLSLFPTDLRIIYMLRPPDSILNPSTAVFLFIMLAFAVSSPWMLRNKRGYFFFGLWFIIALLPVSNIIPIGILMSERAMYLPTVAVCAAGGFLFSSAAGWKVNVSGKRALASLALFLCVAVCLGVLTRARNPVWKDGISMNIARVYAYQRCVANFPESALYYGFLAEAYQTLNRYEDALSALDKGAEIEPEALYIHTDLVKLYVKMKRPDLALPEVRKSISISADQPPAINALFAEVLYKNGLKEEAHRYAEKAVKGYTDRFYVDLAEIANSLWEVGMYGESERFIRKAIELNPYVATQYLYYAHLQMLRSNYGDAMNELDKAEALDPSLPEVYYQRGLVFGSQGMYRDAVSQLEKASKMAPSDARYHYYLAAAYFKAGEKEPAVRELEEALKLNPYYTEASDALENMR